MAFAQERIAAREAGSARSRAAIRASKRTPDPLGGLVEVHATLDARDAHAAARGLTTMLARSSAPSAGSPLNAARGVRPAAPAA